MEFSNFFTLFFKSVNSKMISELIDYPYSATKNIVKILSGEKAIWKRNLLLIAFGQFVAIVGMSAIMPFLPLFVRQLGVTNPEEVKVWSGLVFAGTYTLSLVAVPFWGALGDKYGRKIMMIRALIGLAIAVLLMGFAQNVVQLLILRIIQGGVSGFIAAALSFVSANTPRERNGFAIGILQSSQSAGNILGPLFGGVISDFVGLRPVFYITALLCFLSGLFIQFLVKEDKYEVEKDKSISIKANLMYVLRSKSLRIIFILIILSQISLLLSIPIFPFFVEELKAPKEYLATITGVMVGIVGVFSIIAAPRWGKRNDRKDYRKTINVSSVIIGITLLMHAFINNYIYLFPLRVIIGIFTAAVIPTLYSSLSKKAPPENIGGIMGIASAATFLGALISYVFSGILASTMGMVSTFIISGVIMLIVPMIIYYDK